MLYFQGSFLRIFLLFPSYIKLIIWSDIMYKKNWNYNVICTYGALFLGVLAGCLLSLLSVVFDYGTLQDKGLEDFNISVIMNISSGEMMIYIIRKRMIQIFIYSLTLFVFPYGASSFLFCGSFGVYYGLVVSNLIIKYNLSGLLYGFVCFFPHYYIYFLMIYLIGKWKKHSLNIYYQNMKYVEWFIKFFVIILMLMTSLIWEIKFQKNFLDYFFNI